MLRTTFVSINVQPTSMPTQRLEKDNVLVYAQLGCSRILCQEDVWLTVLWATGLKIQQTTAHRVAGVAVMLTMSLENAW